MPSTIHVPLLGNVPKGAAIAGVGAAVVVTGYLIYKHNKDAVLPTAYGYGSSAYGYGSAAYGAYGYAGGYAGSGYYGYGSEFQSYPFGEEYGYGAYGYGYYNPYTGQYIGPVQGGGGGGTTGTGTDTGTTMPTGPKSGWITIGGKKYYYSSAKGTIGSYIGKGKSRKWVRTKV